MPRGLTKPTGVRAGWLGQGPAAGAGVHAALSLDLPTEEESRSAIRRAVGGFARAWARNDVPAMGKCLHPDFVNRLIGLRSGREPAAGGDPGQVLRSVAGLQATLGDKGPLPEGAQEVRVLDIRARSASAVAVLGGWVLHVHLARAGRRWSIVNAMWELVYGTRQ
jgi:hypothetical protein